MTRGTRFRSALAAAALVVTVALLAGCAPQQSDYGADTADLLQGEVLQVSQLAADSDFDAALASLEELEVALADARARGEITEERYESIMAATAQVRADLEAAIAAQAPPAPAPAPEQGTSDGDDDDDDDGKGNEGKGKGKGKGNSGKDD